eukprot:TRINITY_DN65266_c0_g2_i1.p1 TRINITY_DN65266_c0_g2~~TRINITY_DN65266_c0_g2_i1.p1  ORF type:complete len:160 (-),score=9.24 TRINITY_DN65266_c0_g2_i1:98-577(-)
MIFPCSQMSTFLCILFVRLTTAATDLHCVLSDHWWNDDYPPAAVNFSLDWHNGVATTLLLVQQTIFWFRPHRNHSRKAGQLYATDYTKIEMRPIECLIPLLCDNLPDKHDGYLRFQWKETHNSVILVVHQTREKKQLTGLVVFEIDKHRLLVEDTYCLF